MGYQPAGNVTTTGTITHLIAKYYSRKALTQLRKQFRFLGATTPDSIPQRNGVTVQ